MSLSLVTAATFEQIDLAMARAHLRDDVGAEDDLITLWIKAARERVERDTHLTLCTSTWDYYLDSFPSCDTITLPTWPVSAIASVNYTTEGEAETAFSTSYYSTSIVDFPALARLKSSQSWPTSELEVVNGVRVRFTAGYAQGACPSDLIAAQLLLIGHYYAHRDAVVLGSSAAADSKLLAMGYAHLINPHRLPSGWAI